MNGRLCKKNICYYIISFAQEESIDQQNLNNKGVMQGYISNTRCPSFKRTLLNPYSSWPDEWNFTNFLPGQDELDPFFMFNFQVCGFKIACFIRYLVKDDKNEKSSKAKRLHILTIPWKLEACYSIFSLLISSKLGTGMVYGMPHML